MFDICKALDDRWNQLFAYPVGLAQRWEEMPSISYTFNYAKLMSKVTNDGRNLIYVGCSINLSLEMHPELVECEGYDLKCLGSQSNLVGKGVFLHVWDPGIHWQFVKLNNLDSGILFHIQTQDVLVNIKQLKRPICVLTVHQRESFIGGGGIEKWMVRRWNSQKVDHQQLFKIFEQEHEHVLAKWTTERCGKYRWVEDLDGNNKIKCNMCRIVVHQEFQGVSNAQNLTSWFYLACAKLEFKKSYCFYPTPCGILMASANAFLWTYVTFVWSQLEVAYHNVDTMMNHINQYISVLTKNEMETTLSLEFLSVCIDVFPITAYANVDENVIFDIALVKWLLIYFLQRIDQEDKEDAILVKATFNTYPGLNKFAVIISILFYPNLEDKVLIEDGSIVVNQVDFVRSYVLGILNETDLYGIIGPSNMLESFIWDSGPISYC
uniref:SDG14 (SET DOMAIN PROTEIN 14); DNA binding / protein binding / zinc ion binding n=1 Tax=Solanum tuberosum TaxID=4113 RepID=M0ZLI6_SOLTU